MTDKEMLANLLNQMNALYNDSTTKMKAENLTIQQLWNVAYNIRKFSEQTVDLMEKYESYLTTKNELLTAFEFGDNGHAP